MNLYGFIGNDGIAKTDYLGQMPTGQTIPIQGRLPTLDELGSLAHLPCGMRDWVVNFSQYTSKDHLTLFNQLMSESFDLSKEREEHVRMVYRKNGLPKTKIFFGNSNKAATRSEYREWGWVTKCSDECYTIDAGMRLKVYNMEVYYGLRTKKKGDVAGWIAHELNHIIAEKERGDNIALIYNAQGRRFYRTYHEAMQAKDEFVMELHRALNAQSLAEAKHYDEINVDTPMAGARYPWNSSSIPEFSQLLDFK